GVAELDLLVGHARVVLLVGARNGRCKAQGGARGQQGSAANSRHGGSSFLPRRDDSLRLHHALAVCHYAACDSPSAMWGVKDSPSASATGRQVTWPACTLRPLRKWGSSVMALRQPLSASARTNGRVALFSAKVEVRATAPGMLVTQ